MIRDISILLIGIYIGQEHGNKIPNVKIKAIEYYNIFKQTELYKNLEIKKEK